MITSSHSAIAVSKGGMPALVARPDNGPSMKPMTKAQVAGSSTGRASSSAAISAMTKMPQTAACDAVDQPEDAGAI